MLVLILIGFEREGVVVSIFGSSSQSINDAFPFNVTQIIAEKNNGCLWKL